MCNVSQGHCHLLYLAYRCYREIRLGDDQGRHRWQGDERAKQCAKLRQSDLAEMYRQALTRPSKEAMNPFVARTGFELRELPALFAEATWRRGYGGKKWRLIAEHAVKLASALESEPDQVETLIAEAYALKHNDETTPMIGDGKGVRPQGSCCITFQCTSHA